MNWTSCDRVRHPRVRQSQRAVDQNSLRLNAAKLECRLERRRAHDWPAIDNRQQNVAARGSKEGRAGFVVAAWAGRPGRNNEQVGACAAPAGKFGRAGSCAANFEPLMIPNDFIDTLLRRVDIVEVIDR